MLITVFGEILWDIFGDDKKMGGAPFNFAAHVAKLGGSVKLVSAVGNDDLGKEVIKNTEAVGVDTAYIATVKKPTGRCIVTLDSNGTPSYDIVRDTAMDNIPLPSDGVYESNAFYFGTLAQRSKTSYDTLRALLEKGNYGEVFFDINIRQNYYSDEMIDESLKHTTVFKISREEIDVLHFSGTNEEKCKILAEKYPNLKLIIVTLDKDGSLVYDCKAQRVIYSPKPRSKVVSTVGAGDSFSACFVYNYLSGASIEKCVERATALSDYVVTQLEAVPEYPAELIAKIKQ